VVGGLKDVVRPFGAAVRVDFVDPDRGIEVGRLVGVQTSIPIDDETISTVLIKDNKGFIGGSM
jgi:hypothetical protein